MMTPKQVINTSIFYAFSRGVYEWGLVALQDNVFKQDAKLAAKGLVTNAERLDKWIASMIGEDEKQEAEEGADEMGKFLQRFMEASPETKKQIENYLNKKL